MSIPLSLDGGARVRGATAVNLAIDVGFAALLVVCSVRYFSNHPFGPQGLVVLILAMGSGLAYAYTALAARIARGPAQQRAGILLAIALWLPLVVIAPSYGWCAFALFVAVYRVLQGLPALIASAVMVTAVSVGLLLMSNGQDLGLVLGPFLGGFVLSLAYRGLTQSLDDGRQLITQLVDTRAQLARSEREAGGLAERGRVASELHDTVVQRTASALLLLETAELETGTSPAVAQAQELLRESLAETRQLMHGLVRPGAAREPLAASMQALGSEYDASVEVIGDERAVAESTAHALLRVAQEALINAHKHSGARARKLTLTFFDDAVGVDIADDGVGFDPDRRDPDSAGYGLRAMAWRVESLGGELSLESAMGTGTVVAGVIPDHLGEPTEGQA